MDEQDQESKGTGCVRSEGVDTFEKLLASKNCCLQKGSEGSYVEELLPTAYLSIFSGLWKEFVTKAVAVDPHPILYQYVTNQAFEALIQETFQTSNVQQTSAEPLTYGEENALRYVARYVCHKLQKKITASKHPMRGKLLLCLMDLCDEDKDVSSSADWVHPVDRGGLVHVSETTYMLFDQMELIIRSIYNTDTV